jgi:hypothetical protein
VYELPSYVWALVLAGAIGIPAATCTVLYREAIAAGIGRRAAAAVTVTAAAVLGGWVVVSGSLAGAGVYSQDPGEELPWFLLAVAGTLISLLLATRIPIVTRILADPGTPTRLALPHTLRVVGVLFLIVMAQGHLPAAFALPAGLGDIAIGVAAPFVARRLARGNGRAWPILSRAALLVHAYLGARRRGGEGRMPHLRAHRGETADPVCALARRPSRDSRRTESVSPRA